MRARSRSHPDSSRGIAGDPGNQGQGDSSDDDGPAGGIDSAQLESVSRIPDEVADAVGEMIEERKRPTEQQQPSEYRAQKFLRGRKRRGSCRDGDDPIDQQ